MPKKKLSPEDRAYGRTATPGKDKGLPAGGPSGLKPEVMRTLARVTEARGETDTAKAAKMRAANIEGHQAMTAKAKRAIAVEQRKVELRGARGAFDYKTTARRPK